MVGEDRSRQLETIQHAVDSGIDYFDTAATYGNGRSESCLGAALETLRLSDRVRIATKVRLMPEHLDDIGLAVQNSFESSCDRLGVKRVMLLQLHNSITRNRGDLPTSLSVQDVLGRRGVVAELETLRKEGRVEHVGVTGLGETKSSYTPDSILSAGSVPTRSKSSRKAGTIASGIHFLCCRVDSLRDRKPERHHGTDRVFVSNAD
jgi:aryl-alcohol dehydrogenase-like predicted oxidoreductase